MILVSVKSIQLNYFQQIILFFKYFLNIVDQNNKN